MKGAPCLVFLKKIFLPQDLFFQNIETLKNIRYSRSTASRFLWGLLYKKNKGKTCASELKTLAILFVFLPVLSGMALDSYSEEKSRILQSLGISQAKPVQGRVFYEANFVKLMARVARGVKYNVDNLFNNLKRSDSCRLLALKTLMGSIGLHYKEHSWTEVLPEMPDETYPGGVSGTLRFEDVQWEGSDVSFKAFMDFTYSKGRVRVQLFPKAYKETTFTKDRIINDVVEERGDMFYITSIISEDGSCLKSTLLMDKGMHKSVFWSILTCPVGRSVYVLVNDDKDYFFGYSDDPKAHWFFYNFKDEKWRLKTNKRDDFFLFLR